MGFALEHADEVQNCMPTSVIRSRSKLRLMLVSRGELRCFEPKDRSFLGERKGTWKLGSLTAASPTEGVLFLTSRRESWVFKTPDSQTWAKRLVDPELVSPVGWAEPELAEEEKAVQQASRGFR